MARMDLVDHLLRHTPEEGFNDTPVPGLRLVRQCAPTAKPMPVVYEPSICGIAQGSKRLQVGERAISYDRGSYLVSALTLPAEAEIPEATRDEPYLGFVIRFDRVSVAKLLAEIDGLVEWPVDPPRQVIGACPMDDVLVRAFNRLLACLDDEIDCKVLAEGLMREVLYEVLRVGVPPTQVRQLDGDGASP